MLRGLYAAHIIEAICKSNMSCLELSKNFLGQCAAPLTQPPINMLSDFLATTTMLDKLDISHNLIRE